MAENYTRVRESWTKEAVWRKLNTFCNISSIQKTLDRIGKNEQDIMFAIRTAKSFLNNKSSELPNMLIENYYGCFWLISAMVMIQNEEVSLLDISKASSKGHGLLLNYEHEKNNPLNWLVFIQPIGFMGLVTKYKPFECDIKKVALPADLGKKTIHKNFEKNKLLGFDINSLISRIPELEWHYELLTGKPPPTACVFIYGENAEIHASKLASEDFIRKIFPNIRSLELEKSETSIQPKNHFKVKYCNNEKVSNETMPISYNSLMTDVNAIAKLDKPLDNDLLWHVLLTYSFSIIARYTPHYLQRFENGDLSDWKPFLDEYSWFLRIHMPTACLNLLTKSEWRFSPPALYGG